MNLEIGLIYIKIICSIQGFFGSVSPKEQRNIVLASKVYTLYMEGKMLEMLFTITTFLPL